jgi:hypothetical protein
MPLQSLRKATRNVDDRYVIPLNLLHKNNVVKTNAGPSTPLRFAQDDNLIGKSSIGAPPHGAPKKSPRAFFLGAG